jgi:hypothetical protein
MDMDRRKVLFEVLNLDWIDEHYGPTYHGTVIAPSLMDAFSGLTPQEMKDAIKEYESMGRGIGGEYTAFNIAMCGDKDDALEFSVVDIYEDSRCMIVKLYFRGRIKG